MSKWCFPRFPRGRRSVSSRPIDEKTPLQPVRSESGTTASENHEPVSRSPTGLGQERLNIVILGASFAGLSCAHHFLDDTINHLRMTQAAPNYRLVIISPSTHIYWNIGAPRALVNPDLMPADDIFIDIESGFHRHRGHNFTIIQGEAIGLDAIHRTVQVQLIGSTAQQRAAQLNKRESRINGDVPTSRIQNISYHALIIATGSSAHSELLSLHGPHLSTLGAMTNFHARVAAAKSIVVCGGGPSGVESCGQLSTWLNYSRHRPFRRRVNNPKHITLITGGSRCLPALTPKVSARAEKQLTRLGVEVRHGVRVLAVHEGFDLTGQTKIELNDNTSMIADIYLACTGVEPNTQFVSRALPRVRDGQGYLKTSGDSLRLDDPDAVRVYALGDCAAYSHNYVIDVYAAVPVLMHNLLNDLLTHEYHLASPYGGNQDKIDELQDQQYIPRAMDSILCPITRFGGAGMLVGLAMPSLAVYFLKGKDYVIKKARTVVEDGGSPYAHKTKYE